MQEFNVQFVGFFEQSHSTRQSYNVCILQSWLNSVWSFFGKWFRISAVMIFSEPEILLKAICSTPMNTMIVNFILFPIVQFFISWREIILWDELISNISVNHLYALLPNTSILVKRRVGTMKTKQQQYSYLAMAPNTNLFKPHVDIIKCSFYEK